MVSVCKHTFFPLILCLLKYLHSIASGEIYRNFQRHLEFTMKWCRKMQKSVPSLSFTSHTHPYIFGGANATGTVMMIIRLIEAVIVAKRSDDVICVDDDNDDIERKWHIEFSAPFDSTRLGQTRQLNFWLPLNERHNLIIETSISPCEWNFCLVLRYEMSK